MSTRTKNLASGEPDQRANPPARILVVDDRPTSRAVVKGVLSSSDYIVEEAASGAQALALIESRAFDLVILDILMPDMDGIAVLREIRALYAELPVIMATVKHRSGDMVDALEKGANDYVTKPIDFPVLFARIQRQIAIKRSEDALRESRQSLAQEIEVRTAELERVSSVLEREVSQREKAEREGRAREEQFCDFTEVTADWFWEMDAELRFNYVSQRIEEMTGMASTELIGCTLQQKFAENVAEYQLWEAQLEELEMRRAFDRLEILLERPDGENRVLRMSGKPIFDDGGVFRGYRGAGRDVTEARNLSDELSYRASHDPLTGLVNRNEFEHRLRRALETTRLRNVLQSTGGRTNEHVLCYLDLDQFKVINDTCGHVAGDELLRQVGGVLSEQIRRGDTVARLGGDEFGILMEHCSLEQAQRIADNVRARIEGYSFSWDDKSFSLGVIIGIAPINGYTGGITAVLSAADSACFAAKEQRRNRIHVYREDDAALAKWHGEIQWVGRINKALEENRFLLYFQPIIPINRPTQGPHYEFLLRLKDEDGNIVTPNMFLPAAERYNLATKLDRWVIEESFSWLHRSPEHLEQLYQCSINLSGQSLSDGRFLDFVIRQFNDLDVPPHKICFEVTETAKR